MFNSHLLRYLTSGFKFRERAALGYVQIKRDGRVTKETEGIQARFDIDLAKDTLLLFQEDSDKPVASLSMSDLPTNTILEVSMMELRLQFSRLECAYVRTYTEHDTGGRVFLRVTKKRCATHIWIPLKISTLLLRYWLNIICSGPGLTIS